jgi:Ig-like domain from next to BRCA1 gene
MPTSTPACTDNLTFLEDLSLPDGAVVHPGDVLDKRWLVENSGSCNWNESYRLKFLSGADLSASIEQSLYPARSGTKAIIRIVFTAPDEPGTYQSAWQAYDPQGNPFGDPIFIHIVIDSGQF